MSLSTCLLEAWALAVEGSGGQSEEEEEGGVVQALHAISFLKRALVSPSRPGWGRRSTPNVRSSNASSGLINDHSPFSVCDIAKQYLASCRFQMWKNKKAIILLTVVVGLTIVCLYYNLSCLCCLNQSIGGNVHLV